MNMSIQIFQENSWENVGSPMNFTDFNFPEQNLTLSNLLPGRYQLKLNEGNIQTEIISTANYEYATIQLNDSGATPFTIDDGTYMITVNNDAVGDITIEPNSLTINSNETFNGKYGLFVNDTQIGDDIIIPIKKELTINFPFRFTSRYQKLFVDGAQIGSDIIIPYVKKLSFENYNYNNLIDTREPESYKVYVNGSQIGNDIQVPYVKRLSLQNPTAGAYTVSVDGSQVGDNIIIPYVKKITLNESNPVSSASLSGSQLDYTGSTVDDVILGDNVILASRKKLELQNVSPDVYTVSVDGSPTGDNIIIPHVKKLELRNWTGGAHTVSVDGSQVGDPIKIPHVKKLTINEDIHFESGVNKVYINDDNGDPQEVGNVAIAHVKKLPFKDYDMEIFQSGVHKVYDGQGEQIGNDIKIPLVKKLTLDNYSNISDTTTNDVKLLFINDS